MLCKADIKMFGLMGLLITTVQAADSGPSAGLFLPTYDALLMLRDKKTRGVPCSLTDPYEGAVNPHLALILYTAHAPDAVIEAAGFSPDKVRPLVLAQVPFFSRGVPIVPADVLRLKNNIDGCEDLEFNDDLMGLVLEFCNNFSDVTMENTFKRLITFLRNLPREYRESHELFFSKLLDFCSVRFNVPLHYVLMPSTDSVPLRNKMTDMVDAVSSIAHSPAMLWGQIDSSVNDELLTQGLIRISYECVLATLEKTSAMGVAGVGELTGEVRDTVKESGLGSEGGASA